MEHRRGIRNNLLDEKRHLEKQIERNSVTIEHFRHVSANSFNVEKSKVLDETNREYEIKIQQLDLRLGQLERGELDAEIEEIIRKNTELIRGKTELKHQVNREKREEKKIEKDEADAEFRAAKKKEKNERYEMKAAYKYMSRMEIPDYLQTKLNALPNNHGYMHRGVLFLGMKPAIGGLSKIYEMKKGGVLVIKESTEKETKLYEQKGKNPRQLISVTPRRPLNFIKYVKADEEKRKIPSPKDFPELVPSD